MIASLTAEAQSLRTEDAGSKSAALAARIGAIRIGTTERGTRDVIRSIGADNTATAAGSLGGWSTLTPYRPTAFDESPAGGFAVRLPGTGLDVTNGSLSIRRTSDGRSARGAHFSVQLTY